MQLCSHTSLFTEASSELDLTHLPQFAPPCFWCFHSGPPPAAAFTMRWVDGRAKGTSLALKPTPLLFLTLIWIPRVPAQVAKQPVPTFRSCAALFPVHSSWMWTTRLVWTHLPEDLCMREHTRTRVCVCVHVHQGGVKTNFGCKSLDVCVAGRGTPSRAHEYSLV